MILPKELLIIELNDSKIFNKIFKSLKMRSIRTDQLICKP